MSIVVINDKVAWDAAMDRAKQEGKAVIVDFHAVWCGPCKMIAPHYEQLATEYQEKVMALKVDVDEVDEVSSECKITAMPTFQVYKNGEKVDEMKGANQSKLTELFEKASKL